MPRRRSAVRRRQSRRRPPSGCSGWSQCRSADRNSRGRAAFPDQTRSNSRPLVRLDVVPEIVPSTINPRRRPPRGLPAVNRVCLGEILRAKLERTAPAPLRAAHSTARPSEVLNGVRLCPVHRPAGAARQPRATPFCTPNRPRGATGSLYRRHAGQKIDSRLAVVVRSRAAHRLRRRRRFVA